jgi:type IV secretory pathway VirB10-like protein
MRNHVTRTALLGALLLASAVAHAQFAWLDEKGVRHYSDQPPPPGTPDAKILKVPRGMAAPAPAPAPDDAAASAPATPSPAKGAKKALTTAEREIDYSKRHALAEAEEKLATANKNSADANRKLCEAATRDKAQFESGRRLRTTGNVVMTDEDRARDMAAITKILANCK